MIIVIDGESGTGKSTTARLVAKILGWVCVNTGDIYRQIAYIIQRDGNDYTQIDIVANLLNYTLRDNCLRITEYIDENEIQSENCARNAAIMAKTPCIKDMINESIRAYIRNLNVVVEGRNVATTMSSAEMIKILLYADIDTRAKRRVQQLKSSLDMELAKKSLQLRDSIIQSSSSCYDVQINTSDKDVEDTVVMILREYYRRIHTRSLLELKHFLYSSYQKDTAYIVSANEWSHGNPTRGQCAVTAMIVYEFFGGEIIKGYNQSRKEWHYWNLINNITYDFTKSQYGEDNVCFSNVQCVTFETLINDTETKNRYVILKNRLISIEKRFWEINDQILNCSKCNNAHTPTFETVSLGTECEVLIIGEAPASNGWRLTGSAWKNVKGELVPTGKILKKLLDRTGMDLDEISFLEAIKCYPSGGKVLKAHVKNCRRFFLEQIDILKPQIILTMGKQATDCLLGRSENFSNMVGNTYTIDLFNKTYLVVPIYHTSPVSPMAYKGNKEVFDRIKGLITQCKKREGDIV